MENKILDMNILSVAKYYATCTTIGFATFGFILVPLVNEGYVMSAFIGFIIYYILIVLSLGRYFLYKKDVAYNRG